MTFLSRIFNSIKWRWHFYRHGYTQEDFIRDLRNKGVVVGERTFINQNNTCIDVTRPSMVTIGSDCYLNSGFTLMTHDFVAGVMRNVYGEFINSSGRVTIGNNVGTGVNVTILKGVTIGDNCFIAAHSLVTKSMPANSIIAGSPARVICSLEDYFHKRMETCDEEAKDYARSIRERFGRMPTKDDFWEEFPLFIDKENLQEFDNCIITNQLGRGYSMWLKQYKRRYNSFESFVEAAYKDNNNEK